MLSYRIFYRKFNYLPNISKTSRNSQVPHFVIPATPLAFLGWLLPKL